MLHDTLLIAENGISKQPNVIGDLVLSPEQRQKLVNGGGATSQATVAGAILWPNAVIPYVIDVSFSKFKVTNLL